MTHSKSRQKAEVAFGNLQSQFFAKGKAVEEMDYALLAREEKTLRLREARITKEASDRAAALAALATKPSTKA
ncbi:hypothetical protein LH464_21745 [Neorhizobium sp. T786]|uniref:hypothetical protein n=1 Tax=Pseudorhizobium xiangyangii TaxID=2883104 RepID=UPI001CFFF8E9|nr:hypothetical protein [Neorhizobium xiangyangii]MCB5205094.1 hypothetical protein [Neorhizobium xiangyangii]